MPMLIIKVFLNRFSGYDEQTFFSFYVPIHDFSFLQNSNKTTMLLIKHPENEFCQEFSWMIGKILKSWYFSI